MRIRFFGLALLGLVLLVGSSWAQKSPHGADTNGDWVISHEEMLRVVEMWKAGSYHQDGSGRYVPGRESGPIEPGETITVPLAGLAPGAKPLDMMKIPAGTFTMGSPSDERGRYSWEWSPHEVTITQGFYLGKYEVTQAQWRAVMGSDPSHSSFGQYGRGDDYPVYYVSWNDCQAFIEQLNGMGLGTFRLPTEAEWEYACRAETDTRFSFGDALECADEGDSYCAIMDEYMWWRGNRTYGGEQDGSKEVGRKLPNPWGLHDMHGNLWEWCSDWWQDPSVRGPQVDPQGPSSGSSRVVRGGGWYYYARNCRSAYRNNSSPADRSYSIGVRLLRSYP